MTHTRTKQLYSIILLTSTMFVGTVCADRAENTLSHAVSDIADLNTQLVGKPLSQNCLDKLVESYSSESLDALRAAMIHEGVDLRAAVTISSVVEQAFTPQVLPSMSVRQRLTQLGRNGLRILRTPSGIAATGSVGLFFLAGTWYALSRESTSDEPNVSTKNKQEPTNEVSDDTQTKDVLRPVVGDDLSKQKNESASVGADEKLHFQRESTAELKERSKKQIEETWADVARLNEESEGRYGSSDNSIPTREEQCEELLEAAKGPVANHDENESVSNGEQNPEERPRQQRRGPPAAHGVHTPQTQGRPQDQATTQTPTVDKKAHNGVFLGELLKKGQDGLKSVDRPAKKKEPEVPQTPLHKGFDVMKQRRRAIQGTPSDVGTPESDDWDKDSASPEPHGSNGEQLNE